MLRLGMKTKKVICFNHIDKGMKPEEVDMLKKLYHHYHKKTWCYKKAYKHFKKINLGLHLTSIGLTSTGVIVGGVTLNPIVLGTISGCGILIQGFLKSKNYNRKIEMCKFAYTSYQKILNKIRTYLRGEQYDAEKLTEQLNWLDDEITDLCPIVDKFKAKYDKIFE